MAAIRVNAALRRLLRAPAYLYRWRCGWLLGHRFLLLIHVGRRTGLRRCTVLEVIAFRQASFEMIVLSGFGPDAAWLRNIEAVPDFEVIIGSRRLTAIHRILDQDEATKVIAGYEHRHRLLAPIVRAVLSRLLGWRYDGSDTARRKLVAQLPLIAFRPFGGNGSRG